MYVQQYQSYNLSTTVEQSVAGLAECPVDTQGYTADYSRISESYTFREVDHV